VEAAAIHGDKSQSQRVRTLEGFKRGRVRVLVATDVAARGIHVEEIDTVVNFDLPTEPETYVHRVGRTGRAGASGVAFTLCGADERSQLASIERLTRSTLRKLELPEGLARESRPAPGPARDLARPARPQRRTGGGSGEGRPRRGASGRGRRGARGRRPGSPGPRPV
jgi:ATP-dependent RNA helicase RhlE